MVFFIIFLLYMKLTPSLYSVLILVSLIIYKLFLCCIDTSCFLHRRNMSKEILPEFNGDAVAEEKWLFAQFFKCHRCGKDEVGAKMKSEYGLGLLCRVCYCE